MINFSAKLVDGRTACRVTKQEAKKLYNSGEDIVIAPSKVNLSSPWGLYSIVNNANDMGFDIVTAHFEHYNCNNETGNRLSFYRILKEN